MKKGLLAGMSMLLGAGVGAVVVGKVTNTSIVEKNGKVDKFKGYYNLLNQWLMIKQEGKSLDEYFEKNGYKTVAIYGMGEMGNRLYEELKNTNIEVKYAVDKNATSLYSELEVKELEDLLPEVDVVVVTATFAFNEISEKISDKFACPIISLEDVVYGI